MEWLYLSSCILTCMPTVNVGALFFPRIIWAMKLQNDILIEIWIHVFRVHGGKRRKMDLESCTQADRQTDRQWKRARTSCIRLERQLRLCKGSWNHINSSASLPLVANDRSHHSSGFFGSSAVALLCLCLWKIVLFFLLFLLSPSCS